MLRVVRRPSCRGLAAVIAAAAAASAGAAVQTTGPAPASPAAQNRAADTIELHRVVHLDELRAMRSFFERVDVTSVDAGITVERAAGSPGLGGVLAAMPSDWEAPFRFVQGAIRHVPYAGTVRGVAGALASGGGNALDQALLLQELLSVRGVRSRLVRGRLDWSAAARLVLGTPAPPAPRPDDPWPRWLESASDHWWLQAQRDGEWIDLDPSFPDSAPGRAVGRSGAPQSGIPDRLLTSVRVELLWGDRIVAEATVPAAELVGGTVSLSFAAQSQAAIALWQASADVLQRQTGRWGNVARRVGWLPRSAPSPDRQAGAARARPDGPRVVLPPREERPSVFRRLFLDPDAGPWRARVELAGRRLEAGPFELSDLDTLVLRVAVMAPEVPAHVLEAPWGGGADGRLAIVVGAGAVRDEQLTDLARAMYGSLTRLANAERAARVDMRPPIAYHAAAEGLAQVARAEWGQFAARVPDALGWVLLQSTGRVSTESPGGRMIHPGLRIAAVRWRPPDGAREAALEVLMSDPVTVGQLAGDASAASLRAANGLLQSAVFSQVLNRLTERAPDTAFDVTLRAIGTGRALFPFRDPAALPDAWPLAARAEATRSLAAGYRVLAPASFDGAVAGWWNISVVDGETVGWVPGAQSPLQGRVELGVSGRLDRFQGLLASLPALHRALRWLSELPGSGPGAQATVPMAACASAAVGADAMAASMPPGWPRPDVAALCGTG